MTRGDDNELVSLGRSGPRSKAGCQACKKRRVRCNEARPVCGHCTRLQLECLYVPPQKRRRTTQQVRQNAVAGTAADGSVHETDIGPIQHQDNSELHLEDAAVSAEIEGQPSAPPGSMRQRSSVSAYGGAPFNPMAYPEFGNNMGFSSVRTWEDNDALAEYLPVPDVDFSFPIFQFTESPSFQDPQDSQRRVLGRDQVCHDVTPGSGSAHAAWSEASSSTTLSETAFNLQRDHPHRNLSSDHDSPGDNATSLSILLPSSEQDILLRVFEREVQPPAAIVDIDPSGWHNIKQYLRRLAKGRNESVKTSLLALTKMLRLDSLATSRLSSVGRSHEILLASRLHEAACSAVSREMMADGWETACSNLLLASVFLLAWFEIACDEEDRSHASFPTALAEKIIANGRNLNRSSRHLLEWLSLLDGKASHMGGKVLFSEATADILLKRRAAMNSLHVVDFDQSVPGSPEHMVPAHELSAGQLTTTTRSKQTPSCRLSALLSSRSVNVPPPSVIRTDIFNILLRPAFEFHLISQSYSKKIGSQDRHHRSQDTAEDAFEVMENCRRFENELQDLWCRRPGILNLGAAQLKHFVSEDIARRLEQLFSVYLTTFWAHFIYIQRVAHWNYKHTPIAEKAIQETGIYLRRGVGQPSDRLAFDREEKRTQDNTIHPGLIWTCFMFGCEVPNPVEQEWAVLQLNALGQNASARTARSQGDGFAVSRLEDKSARNAQKVSELLKVLVRRQAEARCRIDGKYLCQELFGCHFYII